MRALSSSSASTSERVSCSSRQQPHRAPTSLRGATPHQRRRSCCHRNQTSPPTVKTAALPAWPSSSSDSSPSERARWRVRPIRPDEIVAAAELQARAFYTSYPLGPLDALMFYQFRGEVLSGLQSKMKYSQDDGFVCLVAERVPPLRALFSKRTKNNKSDAADDDDDLSALDELSSFSSSSADSDSLPPIAGVVEVSLQGEKKELEALWGVTGLMGASSSSSSGDDDGGGESGVGGGAGTGAGEGGGGGGLLKGLFGGWSASSSSSSADLPPPSAPTRGDGGGLSDESYAYVACMAVDERCRRSGAASALLAAAERAAGRWGQTWVLLHVHAANAGARALYARAGYAPLGPAERPGIVGAPRVLMGKQSGSSVAAAPGGGITSIPSDLLGALKRDSEERAAKARRDKAEEGRG